MATISDGEGPPAVPYPGLTFYAPITFPGASYLIDRDGERVHEWTFPYTIFSARLLPDASMVALLNSRQRPDIEWPVDTHIRKLDWDGDTVWVYENDNIHHDFTLLPNGNVVAIAWEEMSSENIARVQPPASGDYYTDVFMEIDVSTGQSVWEWHVQDEMVIENYAPTIKSVEFTHANTVEYLPEGNVFNGIPSFLVSFAYINTILILERESGNIAWEYGGNPQLLSSQHSPVLLDNGNILVFDNRPNSTVGSRVLEIVPETKEIAWKYEASGFLSNYVSGAQRLRNGNTLICEGDKGRIFEVDEMGNIVWEFIEPDSHPLFRAHKYGIDEIAWPDWSLFD